jgi:hypothetical protein
MLMQISPAATLNGPDFVQIVDRSGNGIHVGRGFIGFFSLLDDDHAPFY